MMRHPITFLILLGLLTQGQNIRSQTSENPGLKSSNSTDGILSTEVNDHQIVLEDGRTFSLISEEFEETFTSSVEIVQPAGAKVSIYYKQSLLSEGEVPFTFNDNGIGRSGSFFTIKVAEESGPTWSANLKLRNARKLIIGRTIDPKISLEEKASAEVTCQYPIADSEFKKLIESLKATAFESEKMTVFLKSIESYCLSTEQVIKVMGQFVHDKRKLMVAQYSYPKVTNKDQFHMVNESFNTTETPKVLNELLEERSNSISGLD